MLCHQRWRRMSVQTPVLKDFAVPVRMAVIFFLPDLYMNAIIIMIHEDACVNHDMCISQKGGTLRTLQSSLLRFLFSPSSFRILFS